MLIDKVLEELRKELHLRQEEINVVREAILSYAIDCLHSRKVQYETMEAAQINVGDE